jgi:RNA polymerase sigma factor (sigma-70 family)
MNRVELAESLRPRIYRFALRLCDRHTEDAEDLTQDTFVKLYAQIDSLGDYVDEESGMRRLLYAICRNTHISNIRRASVISFLPLPARWTDNFEPGERASAVPDALLDFETPETIAIDTELREILERAVDTLSRPQQHLIASILAGIPQHEYARLHNRTTGAISNRAYNARLHLREKLSAAL